MDTTETLTTLGVSLGLGLLVGLQRERKGEELAGIRTFALLSVLGTVMGMVGKQLGGVGGGWMVPAGAVAVGGIMAVGAILKARVNLKEIGLTTEIAALVMYGLGAYLVEGDKVVAVVLGGVVVLVLYWKAMLHGLVRSMGERDFAAIMQFVLIALVIWPILPREHFGPYGFFNPFETWLVVVLVVGMSLAGYVLYKLVPPTAGAILGGAVGGLISSTATTVAYARRAKGDGGGTGTVLALQAIMMANLVSMGRVMVLLMLFAGEAAWGMMGPLGAMAGVMGILVVAAYWAGRGEKAELPEQGNPSELKSALLFAGIYTAVKLATAWVKASFALSALYVLGGVSGLTDLDAITLSMGESAKNQSVEAGVVWRVVMVAVLANLVFKGGCVMVLGNGRLKRWVGVMFGVVFLAGVGIILGWRW